MRVITFSRQFPVKHPRAGEPTFFVEQIYNGIGFKIGTTKQSGDIPEAMWDKVNDFVLLDGEHKKYHTIRAGNRWNVGDWFSPRIWSGKPYASKQIEFAPPIEIKKIWDIEIRFTETKWFFKLNGIDMSDEITDFCIDDFVEELAKNDGLTLPDFLNWFEIHPKRTTSFNGQILCWNNSIDYLNTLIIDVPSVERSVASKVS